MLHSVTPASKLEPGAQTLCPAEENIKAQLEKIYCGAKDQVLPGVLLVWGMPGGLQGEDSQAPGSNSPPLEEERMGTAGSRVYRSVCFSSPVSPALRMYISSFPTLQ